MSYLARSAATTMRDVVDFNPRLTSKLDDDDEVAFVSMSGISAERATTVVVERRPYRDVSKGYTPFRNGDVIVAKITPCFQNGKIAQAALPIDVGFGSTEFHILRPKNGAVDHRYLLHFLRQPTIAVEGEKRMTGSAGQRRVPEAFLAELKIPLPPLPEQRRIAAVLDAADALRAKRRAALAHLDTLTQAIFVEMFGDEKSGGSRWSMQTVSSYVAGFEGGKSLEAESGEEAITKNRVLKVSAVTGMRFRPLESKPVPDTYLPPQSHFVRQGDLLFSRANTAELTGAVAYVDESHANLLLPDKLWRFHWRDPTTVEPRFIWALFQTRRVRHEISRRATGTSGSMKNISQEKVFAIETMFPPIDLQKAFAGRLATCERIRSQTIDAIAASDALFAALQHRAFRGEL